MRATGGSKPGLAEDANFLNPVDTPEVMEKSLVLGVHVAGGDGQHEPFP